MPCANSDSGFGRRLAAIFLKSLMPLAILLLAAGFVYARWIDTARVERTDGLGAQGFSKD